MPLIIWMGRPSTPGASMSISMNEMPRCLSFLSVQTVAKHLSAHWPPLVHVFCLLTK